MISLAHSNIFGQNTPAIAASEADYSEMWAQDIVAMDGYAGTSAAASELTPFTSPPPTTTAAEPLTAAATPAAQAAAAPAAGVSVLPTLQSFLPPPLDALPNPFEDLDILVAAAVAVAAGSLAVSTVQLSEVYRHDMVDEYEKAPICPGKRKRAQLRVGPTLSSPAGHDLQRRAEEDSPPRPSHRQLHFPGIRPISAGFRCRRAGCFRPRCAKSRRCSPAPLRCS